MNHLLQVTCSVISAAICLRVLTHPHYDHHKPTFLSGLCCWFLMIGTAGIAITTLCSPHTAHVIGFDVIVLSLLAILVFRYKGSPALLFGVKR